MAPETQEANRIWPEAWSKKSIAAGSNTPILLEGDADVLLVEEGHVDVFLVRRDQDGQLGSRQTLYRAEAGEAVFGTRADLGEGSHLHLLAVGTVGTKVIQGLVRQDLPDLKPDHLSSITETHLNRLLDFLALEHPEKRVEVIEGGEDRELFREKPVGTAGRELLWLDAVEPDSLLLFGQEERKAKKLPINGTCWVTSTCVQFVKTLGTDDLITDGSWESSLKELGDHLAPMIVAKVEETEAAAAERQRATNTIRERAMKQSLEGMAETVNAPSAKGVALPITSDPLHSVFLMVARSLKVPTAQEEKRLAPARGVAPIDVLSLSYRVRYRKVLLRGQWWKEDIGPLIAYRGEGRQPVALLQEGANRMVEVDPATGARSLIDKKMAEELHGEALMLYRPLPPGAKKVRDLLGYLFPTISGDVLRMFGIGFVSALLGLAIPLFSGLLVENIIPRADLQTHTLMICALVVVAFGSAVFELVKAMALFRIESKSDSLLQAAIFDRVLQLPVAILRKYTAGDLTDRALGVQTIRATLTGSTLQSMLSVVFSVISLGLLFYYSWKLALVAVGISVAGMGLMIWLGLRQLSHERERIRHQGQAEGLVVQILTGISKLRVAAAESRAFARWSNFFSQQKKCFVLAQRFANLQELFQAVLPVLAAAIIFWATSSFIEADAIAQQLRSLVGGGASSDFFSTGDFVAFNAAFGQFLAAMTGFGIALTKGLSAIPMLERLSPILESEPEMATEAKAVEKLKGGIEIAQVQFRYAPKAPLILDELSLNIHPNEFVALVGPSGSGKSTLMRLLLGFEKPEAGDVLLDGIPLSSLDLTSVRQQMRVVLQQGRISNGSIFENIVGNSTLTLDDAWAAAKLAGFDEDIESMPMGMHTVLVEGVNTLSGGQRQRLMIARALVHRPNILLLDEPTSALDNHTQETVMKSLGEFKATRILIAHRLSTVRFVDRIVVMNQGKLAEQGTFDELMAMNGLFTEMARRQQL